jgi:hypothetical protein
MLSFVPVLHVYLGVTIGYLLNYQLILFIPFGSQLKAFQQCLRGRRSFVIRLAQFHGEM